MMVPHPYRHGFMRDTLDRYGLGRKMTQAEMQERRTMKSKLHRGLRVRDGWTDEQRAAEDLELEIEILAFIAMREAMAEMEAAACLDLNPSSIMPN